MKRRLNLLLAAIFVIGFVSLGAHNLVSTNNKVHLREIQLQSTTNDLKTLELKQKALSVELEKALNEKSINLEKVKQLEQQNQQLQSEKQSLEQQVAAKREAQRIAKLNTPIHFTARASAASYSVSNCGENFYANYIYSHESGCKTHNPNGSGCDGIGQACPGSKVIDPCGYDYACQNRWFTNYAVQRYGSWKGAYDFWLNHHWW